MKIQMNEDQAYAIARNIESMKSLISLSIEDPEAALGKGEDLLLDTLKVLGMDEIVDHYNKLNQR